MNLIAVCAVAQTEHSRERVALGNLLQRAEATRSDVVIVYADGKRIAEYH